MLFNSPEFLLLFLPATLLAFSIARRYGPGPALIVVIVASVAFYSVWEWRHTPLLLASILMNFALGRLLARGGSRTLLATAIALNLAPLLWFKYAHWLGQLAGVALPPQGLPLGISFVTFLQIAFLVDVWRRRAPAPRPLAYAAFVTWFPHLISGPILRYTDMHGQLARLGQQAQDAQTVARALLLIVTGLFSKVAVADTVATYVDPLYERAAALGFWEAWTAAVGYSVQLLADFGGFCTVALGVSLLFGVQIPINFWSPYRATSISEFWRRWHISLGQFFRDYVYIPMGGNRAGLPRQIAALMVTFFLAGLWHGAAGTFVLWGLMHGAMVVAHRLWQRCGLSLPDRPAQLLTLLAVILAWVPFRASSIDDAVAIWRAMSGINGITVPDGLAVFGAFIPSWVRFAPTPGLSGSELFVLLALLAVMASAPNVHEWKLAPRASWAAAIGSLALVVSFSLSRPSPYLYWQW